MPLQQCLPFTVLKRTIYNFAVLSIIALQQCLPFTVLKLQRASFDFYGCRKVATVLTVYGIETACNAATALW